MPARYWLMCEVFLYAALVVGASHAQVAAPIAPTSAASSEPDPDILVEQAAKARLMKTLFGDEAPKARVRACFTRDYDAAHLKAHPHQHVVEIRISAHYDPIVRTQKDAEGPRQKWGYAIHSRLRDGKLKIFQDEGSCSSSVANADSGDAHLQILCNAACDSGDHFIIEPDGRSAKLTARDDLVHPEYVEPGAPAKLAAKADDGVFRVYRVKESLCDFDRP